MKKTAILLIVLLAGIVGVSAYLLFMQPPDDAPSSGPAEVSSVRAGGGGKTGGKGAGGAVEVPAAAGGAVDVPTAAGGKTDRPSSAAWAPEDHYEKGEVLVVDPPAGFFDIVRRLGFTLIEKTQLGELGMTVYVLRVPVGSSVSNARHLLAERFPGVEIDANHFYETKGVSENIQHLPRRKTGWRDAVPTCGAGVRVGMIDTPVDLEHPALAGRRIRHKSFHRKKRRQAKADHGTAVAGILVGVPEWGGLLPAAELSAANIFDIDKTGKTRGNANGLIKAVEWLLRERVDVINFSLAGADNKALRRAVFKARRKGMPMVAAAGDRGVETAVYPAAYKEVIAVTALGAKRVAYKHANRGRFIEFAAPGVRIYTAVPGGGRLQSGTSFASPFIAAIAGFLVERNRKMGTKKLRKLLVSRAVDLGKPGRDNVYGWGFVNLQPKCG
jgi:subtilisin family serine protease